MKKLLYTLAAAILGFAACQPIGLTDESGFKLYYPGVTDMGPSSSINVTPTWHGGTPADFSIYALTLAGSPIESASFSVDASTGVVYIKNTDDLAVGVYSISISCSAGGRSYSFDNIISVKILPAVPSGITVEPNKISVSLGDIMDGKDLPTARIKTDGDHISIKGYYINSARRDGIEIKNFTDLFAVSSKGKVSIKAGNGSFIPGVYVLDFKLTTYVVGKDSQDGVFKDALTISVTSEPISLDYAPDSGKVEAGYAWASSVPALIGSSDGIVYTLKNVEPSCPALSINASTGVLSVAEGNTLAVGSEYSVSVSAKNDFGSKDFDNIFSLKVVDYIAPITTFRYGAPGELIQAVGFAIGVAEIAGDEVSYSFVNLPADLADLTIDPVSGLVSALKGNSITAGEHTVKVKAENAKGSKEATLTFTISPNPYYFTYVHWGNNLGLTPARNYASQYRVQVGGTEELTIPVADSDIPAGQPVSFAVKGGFHKDKVKIDAATGTITTVSGGDRAYVAMIRVTVGEGEAAIVRTIPFFVHYSVSFGSGIKIEYTPFVFQCNPKTGGVSATPTITGADPATFTLDYRRDFNYYNIGGPESHVSGIVNKVSGCFLQGVWANYFASIGKAVNYGARAPMSAWDGNSSNASLRLAYVRKNDFAVEVNPEKFKDDAGYANGVLLGAMTCATNGADPQAAGANMRPSGIIIWFDTDF